MTREEAMNHLQAIAAEQGAKIYTEFEANGLYGHPILVAREKNANDNSNNFGPLSPLKLSRFEVEVQMQRQPQKNPDELEQLGICYQQLAAVNRALAKEPEIIFDTTPELKAEYERKHDLLFNQLGKSEDKVEQAVHQAAVEWFKKYPYQKFGFDATNFHVALAKAVAEADGFQHENLPVEMLEKYDPYLITTEKGTSTKEMAELMRDHMLCSERDKKNIAATVHDYAPIYTTDEDELVDMNLRQMEKFDRSYVYGFLEWRDDAIYGDRYEAGASPQSYEAMEDLLNRLKKRDLLVGEVPDFANFPYDSLYAVTCRINTNILAVQNVIKEWHQDWTNEESFWDEEENSNMYYDFLCRLKEDAKLDFANQLSYEDNPAGHKYFAADYVLLNLDNIRCPDEFAEPEDNVYIQQANFGWSAEKYREKICERIEKMLGEGEDYTVYYSLENAVPFKVFSDSTELVLIPARQFVKAMEEHPDIKEAIEQNLLPQLPKDSEFMDFWNGKMHEFSSDVVAGHLMQELENEDLQQDGQNLLLDTILSYPVETIRKRISTEMKEKSYSTSFDDAVYAKRQVLENRPEFKALWEEYDAYRWEPADSAIIRKLVGSKEDHAEAVKLLHEKAKSLQK